MLLGSELLDKFTVAIKIIDSPRKSLSKQIELREYTLHFEATFGKWTISVSCFNAFSTK